MSYINKQTFEIYHDIDESSCDFYKEHFEVDELIADAVALFNKKGYKTKFSCASHLYPEVVVCKLEDKDTAKYIEDCFKVVKINEENENPNFRYMGLVKSNLNEISICFEHKYNIASYFNESEYFEVDTVLQWEVIRESPGHDTDCGNGITLPNVEAIEKERTCISSTLSTKSGFGKIYEIVAAISELLEIISQIPTK